MSAPELQRCTLYRLSFAVQVHFDAEARRDVSAYRCPLCGRPMLRPEQGEAETARCVSEGEWHAQMQKVYGVKGEGCA